MPHKRIVCTTDFSEASDHAVREGAELAAALGAELILLHVSAPTPPPVSGGLFPTEAELTRAAESAREKVQHELSQVRDRCGVPAEVRLAEAHDASPVEGILGFVESEGVDLVVIATAGRSGLQRWLIGSVTERVVRHAKCAVLTVKVPPPA